MKVKMFIGIAAASLMFVGCGEKVSTAPAEEVTGSQRIVSARGELTKMANNDFPDDYFGVGQGTSNNEGMAAEIAGTNARGALATEMETDISTRAKNAGLNTVNGEAIETYMRRVVEGAQATISGIRVQETITEFNQADGKYTVYTLVTVSKGAANGSLKQQISGEQAITDALISKALMDVIDSELGE